jgi:hypothetical protein
MHASKHSLSPMHACTGPMHHPLPPAHSFEAPARPHVMHAGQQRDALGEGDLPHDVQDQGGVPAAGNDFGPAS